MPLTCQQLITLATQDARKPGFTSQAGQLLNQILSDLCFKHNLEINLKPTTITLTGSPTGPDSWSGVTAGVGPYALPSDYLRMADKEVIYNFNTAPIKMIQTDVSEIDFMGILPITSVYPIRYATDRPQGLISGGNLYVWPPPQNVIVINFRYYFLQGDITNPQTSAVVPWFPDQFYLQTKLTALLLKPNPAWEKWNSDANEFLTDYLKLEKDSNARAIRVEWDERVYRPGGQYGSLPPTKQIPWGLVFYPLLLPLVDAISHAWSSLATILC